ncbi:Crp/Fnr family transcriptional regulator [Nibrella saemangeumensis]|uniref:Crp/Fnr family transcriptional regulator n=2 Tax=Nibrella saemangeumensis TaxID=1084526 RepID=A0ABP8N2I1_9BACT
MHKLLESCQIRHLTKDEFLTQEHQPDTYEYFLLEGLVHRSLLGEHGEYVTTGFYTAPTVVTPHFARTVTGRSLFTLQALTPACVAYMPVAALDALRYSLDDVKRFGQDVLADELRQSIHHEVAFRAWSAKERLLDLRQAYPNLENLVPHSLIASYLGITPVSFSRLRHELAQHR